MHTTFFPEEYGNEEVNSYENLKYITEPYSLFTIDFNSCDEVMGMLNRQRPHNSIFNPTVDDETNMLVG